ncbi:glycosyltransferase family 4 protein [Chryseobacterium sp. BIGb0232]|uniref:glycosyltransferase family 4 protein n=1 Tax=Chryseobacterium sp. BIGb0232 TaxID=2940598 RepID=UPI000F467A06|nr:glycosyltransferase family 4 protein [Chryseobacterium sp. BIGb0232]MCS4301631.1 glycosyltransferase involved in cell wall biosynthesis [Chryseobacterium sp. BIGb0232]ROS19515.1 glycosyltransferase involved in cell wall biosynthesis [Chryseobacterium nakagawai]
MKILIVTQYFYPENFKSNDMAFELQKRGHEVTVLTGIPNYPEGEIYDGYGFSENREQIINGVKVIRALLLPRGKGGGIRIFLNYFSWAFFASLKARKLSSREKYDAIIVHEPSPITQFYPALAIKKIHKTPIYFWVMDLWPESLEIAGGVKNKLVLNFFTKMVQKFYNESEKILITSKGFKKSILEKGNYEDKIEYFPNWAEDTISSGNLVYAIPELPDGFKVMFAGNIGEAQDMESIMQAALQLKKNTDIKIILVGDGRKMSFVHDFIKEHSLQETVYTMGRFPVEAMASFFNAADILLVSLKDDPIFNLTVPAKVQAYMSSGKPIMAMLNGEGAENIKEADCGFTVPAGDGDQLAQRIAEAAQKNKEELNIMGLNGKSFYEKNYKMEECISNLEKIISKK